MLEELEDVDIVEVEDVELVEDDDDEELELDVGGEDEGPEKRSG